MSTSSHTLELFTLNSDSDDIGLFGKRYFEGLSVPTKNKLQINKWKCYVVPCVSLMLLFKVHLVWVLETCLTIRIAFHLIVWHKLYSRSKGYVYFNHLSLQYLHMPFQYFQHLCLVPLSMWLETFQHMWVPIMASSHFHLLWHNIIWSSTQYDSS
jgi:hypothetical protein